jgi:hypothetical protein
MMQENRQMKWAFWFQWLIASILGFVFGLGVSCGVTAFFPVYYGDSNPIYRAISMLRLALGATSIGCSIGVFQWSVLRSYVSKWWVFATAVGWAIGGLAISTISDTMNYVPSAENWRVVLVGVIWGGAIGVAQSLVLRQQVGESMQLWSLMNATCFSIGVVITLFAVGNLDDAWRRWGPTGEKAVLFNGLFIGSFACITLTAATTGLALVWLLQGRKISTTE